MTRVTRPSFLIVLALLALVRVSNAAESRSTTVGMSARIEQLVLPGPELEVKPIEALKTPVVIRITEVYPHGSSFRYDLEYYAIIPGSYDLGKFLKRKDGTPADNLPPIPVTVTSVLPPGQIEPNKVVPHKTPYLGGYRLLLLLGAMAWSAGMVLILYLTRREPEAAHAAEGRPLTLADRLRPLVESAVAGTLNPSQFAELERLLIGYWRRKNGLEQVDPAVAIATLRNHPEAGPMIHQLEEWLHRPGGEKNVDVATLLTPYQDIPADDPESVKLGEPVPSGRSP